MPDFVSNMVQYYCDTNYKRKRGKCTPKFWGVVDSKIAVLSNENQGKVLIKSQERYFSKSVGT